MSNNEYAFFSLNNGQIQSTGRSREAAAAAFLSATGQPVDAFEADGSVGFSPTSTDLRVLLNEGKLPRVEWADGILGLHSSEIDQEDDGSEEEDEKEMSDSDIEELASEIADDGLSSDGEDNEACGWKGGTAQEYAEFCLEGSTGDELYSALSGLSADERARLARAVKAALVEGYDPDKHDPVLDLDGIAERLVDQALDWRENFFDPSRSEDGKEAEDFAFYVCYYGIGIDVSGVPSHHQDELTRIVLEKLEETYDPDTHDLVEDDYDDEEEEDEDHEDAEA